MKNLTLCLIMHLFNKNTHLCRCPLNSRTEESDYQPMVVNVNYITQKGNSNIAGDGTIEYKTMQDKITKLERLEAENRMLAEMLQMLRRREKTSNR